MLRLAQASVVSLALLFSAAANAQDLCAQVCELRLNPSTSCAANEAWTPLDSWDASQPLRVQMRCQGDCCLPGLEQSCSVQQTIVGASALRLWQWTGVEWLAVQVEFVRLEQRCPDSAFFESEGILPSGRYRLGELEFDVQQRETRTPLPVSEPEPAVLEPGYTPLPTTPSREPAPPARWVGPRLGDWSLESTFLLHAGFGFVGEDTAVFDAGGMLASGVHYQLEVGDEGFGWMFLELFIGNHIGLDFLGFARLFDGAPVYGLGVAPVFRQVLSAGDDLAAAWRIPSLFCIFAPAVGVSFADGQYDGYWLGWQLPFSVLV
ncbi:MAG: hypothetical protein RBU37_07735, partial [Myxococcota bacterium]|nr:hypothetical protein [Myxococcota bacterium]